MGRRYRFGTKSRDALWARDCLEAWDAGRGRNPICCHCDTPVLPRDPWDECHDASPKWAGGRHKHVGHRDCNRNHNNAVDTPAFHKSNRVRDRHAGIRGPGLGPHPMRAGRLSRFSKTFARGLQPRLTHAEKHALFLASRAISPDPPEA